MPRKSILGHSLAVYKRYLLHIQFFGICAVVLPASFTLWMLINDAKAYAPRLTTAETKITALEYNNKNIMDKLDLIIRYTAPHP